MQNEKQKAAEKWAIGAGVGKEEPDLYEWITGAFLAGVAWQKKYGVCRNCGYAATIRFEREVKRK